MENIKQSRKCGMFPFLFLLLFIFTPHLYSQSGRFTILHTSDEHSVLMPIPLVDYEPGRENPALGGYARLATLVDRIRKEKGEEPVLLFSSGDNIGGTPFAWLIPEGLSPEIELMRAVGYNATTIGNHEFDYGPDVLAEYFLRAGYPEQGRDLPVIASNLVVPDDHDLLRAGLRQNHIYNLPGNIRLGVFGILGRTAYDLASTAEPADIEDPLTAARHQVSLLREDGADIIVALTHAGIAEDREMARRVDGIDIILGGHDHLPLHQPEYINNTFIMHSGNYLQYLGNYEFEWNRETGRLSLVNDLHRSDYFLPLSSAIDEDPRILAMTMEYLRQLNDFVADQTGGRFTDVREPIVYSAFPLEIPHPFTETAVGNFVTDAMRLMAEEITGERVDFAFQADGVIRADILPGTMEWSEGNISLFDLVTVSGLGTGPDGNAGYPLVSVYLTGREVLNVLEISSLLSLVMGDIYFFQVSGMRFAYDPGKATWGRLPDGRPVPAYRAIAWAEVYAGEGIQDDVNFEPFENDRLYHVVTDYYLTAFMPMVGEILPRLTVVLKDRNGNPVTPQETIIIHEQREYKVWEALAGYAASLPVDDEIGLPSIPVFYSFVGERITRLEGTPLVYWTWFFIAGIVVIITLLIFLAVKKFRARRTT
jgi:5'-nucleotidase / UDP-sugar diphosphatase